MKWRVTRALHERMTETIRLAHADCQTTDDLIGYALRCHAKQSCSNLPEPECTTRDNSTVLTIADYPHAPKRLAQIVTWYLNRQRPHEWRNLWEQRRNAQLQDA